MVGRCVVVVSGGSAMPQACMTNADVARLINSDEVQSIVNPAKEGGMLGELPLGAKKSNPLKNRAAMLKLNPYFATIQKNEMSGATKRSASSTAPRRRTCACGTP